MGIRFRKSVKIAPGIRVNFSGSGASMTLGPRGATVNIGKRGTYLNTGIPGTGLYSRSQLSNTSSARQLERERRKAQKEQEKLEKLRRRQEALANVTLSLSENGNIEAKNAVGEQLGKPDLRLLWEQKEEDVRNWLEERCNEVNGDVDLLAEIYLDTPTPNREPEYSPEQFELSPPNKPNKSKLPEKPCFKELPPLVFWKRLFKRSREKHAHNMEENELRYNKALAKWRKTVEFNVKDHKKALANWERELEVWRHKKEKHEAEQLVLGEAFANEIRTNSELMSSQLESAFDTLSWPRETLISYQVESNGQMVLLDVDLPEIEDLPNKTASLSANGRKLNIKDKAQKLLRQEYALHIHGIALRLAGTTFAELPICEMVVVSGYSQRLDKATGVTNDDYLFSIKFTRDGFEKLNFENFELVDPIEAVTLFEHRRKMTTTGVFKAVEPFSA